MLRRLGIGHSHSHGHAHLQDFSDEEHNEKQRSGIESIKKLVNLARPEAFYLSLACCALLVSGGVNLAMPYTMGTLFDTNQESSATKTVVILCGIFVLGVFFTFWKAFLFIYAGERLAAKLRNDLFSQIIIQDVSFFDVNKTGELVNRLSVDTNLIQMASTVTFSNILKFGLQVFGGTFALLLLSWKLTLVMLLPFPLLGLFAWLYGRFVRRLGKRIQNSLAQCTVVAEEAISSIRYVRSFGTENIEKRRYGTKVAHAFSLGKLGALASGMYQGGAELGAYIAIVLVVYYGTYLYLNEELSKGDFLAYILYAIYVSHALGALSGQVGEFMRAIGASDRVLTLLQRKPEINITGGVKPNTLHGHIEFQEVNFSYPSRPNVPVLSDFNLQLPPNTVVALVGPSGGGKTTVAQLILRLYDVADGKILLDGINIKEIDPRWLRGQIGFVGQESVLFDTSIRENVSYGRMDASQEQIEEACKAAFIHDFICTLPDGYSTVVGERGAKLSGGQKQRIAIARAILKEPRILILDEATSALDTESEHLVQQALEGLVQNRTVLIIAHRLSTVKNANVLAVISDGHLVEKGTHENLMQNENGFYFRLVTRQTNLVEPIQKHSESEDFLLRDIDKPSSSSIGDSLDNTRPINVVTHSSHRSKSLIPEEVALLIDNHEDENSIGENNSSI